MAKIAKTPRNCIIHAGGWEYTKANLAMLWSVYSRVQTVAGVIGILIPVFGPKMLGPSFSTGEGSIPGDLASLEKNANDLLTRLRSLADREDARKAIEEMGPEIIDLHQQFHSLVRTLVSANLSISKLVPMKKASVRHEAEAEAQRD